MEPAWTEPPNPSLTCGNATHTVWTENSSPHPFSIWDRAVGLSTSRATVARVESYSLFMHRFVVTSYVMVIGSATGPYVR